MLALLMQQEIHAQLQQKLTYRIRAIHMNANVIQNILLRAAYQGWLKAGFSVGFRHYHAIALCRVWIATCQILEVSCACILLLCLFFTKQGQRHYVIQYCIAAGLAL